METEKLSAPTAPLGCFLLPLPAEAERHRAGWEPRRRGLWAQPPRGLMDGGPSS